MSYARSYLWRNVIRLGRVLPVTAPLPLPYTKEYEDIWEKLPNDCFSLLDMKRLNMLSLQTVPKQRGHRVFETAYLPFNRARDFLRGESFRCSNPLDPHDRLFSVSRESYGHRTVVAATNPIEEVSPSTEIPNTNKEPLETRRSPPPFPACRHFKCRYSHTCPVTFSIGAPLGPDRVLPIRFLSDQTHVGHCVSTCPDHPSWDLDNKEGLPCPIHNHNRSTDKKYIDVYGSTPFSISEACKVWLHSELTRYPTMKSALVIKAWREFYHSYNPPVMVNGLPYPRKDDLVNRRDVNDIRRKLMVSKRGATDVVTSLDNYVRLHPENVPFRQDSEYVSCSECELKATHGPKPKDAAVGVASHCHIHAPSGFTNNQPDGVLCQPWQMALQTPAMTKKLRQHDSTLLIDSTHNTNWNRFECFNAMVVTQFGDGLNVSHLITQRGTQQDLVSWLQHIKSSVEQGRPSGKEWAPLIIIDMSEAELNAIIQVFGESYRTENVLYCSWHVLRAWVKNTWMKIKPDKSDPKIRSKVIGSLVSLLYNHDNLDLSREQRQANVEEQFDSLVSQWSKHKVTKAFAEYLAKEYRGSICRWAHAVVGQSLSGHWTNNLLERFHGGYHPSLLVYNPRPCTPPPLHTERN